jgi:type IV secretory pathway protease TraF
MYNVCNVYALILFWLYQHAHIDNLKTIANLPNNKDVFMYIIRFHARAGYLQTYETLLKEINAHPGSAYVPGADDQYQVERLALADSNTNLPCETGIHYPSLTAMLNRRDMMWRITV